MISGEVLKYLKGEHVVIHQKWGSTAKPSSLSDNACASILMRVLICLKAPFAWMAAVRTNRVCANAAFYGFRGGEFTEIQ